MKSPYFFIFFLLFASFLQAQNLQVTTIVENINASGGVTIGLDGNIYVSDYAPTFQQPAQPTKVYKVEYSTWEVSVFADGFEGASGSCFDEEGNFYQSNPFGSKISRIGTGGTIEPDWATDSLSLPVGIQQGLDGNFYVCDCNLRKIFRIQPDGSVSVFAQGDQFVCPNGLTIDPVGNLYSCNFSDGKVLKTTPDGVVSEITQIPQLTGGPNPVGAGHLTWKNNFLFVTAIGRGQIFKVDMEGNQELIAGVALGFSNNDGPALQATFSKPNGIAASITGDTLFVNVSDPTWVNNPGGLHPAHLRMITGVCSLPDVQCDLLNDTKEEKKSADHLITISPNPANTIVHISLDLSLQKHCPFEMELIDVNGKQLKSLIIEDAEEHALSLEDVSPGLYLLRAENPRFQLSKKLIVK